MSGNVHMTARQTNNLLVLLYYTNKLGSQMTALDQGISESDNCSTVFDPVVLIASTNRICLNDGRTSNNVHIVARKRSEIHRHLV